MGGIIAGCMLVFIPAVGEFVIPALLGGPDSLMIGRVLWEEFFNNRDWPIASAVAIAMLLVLRDPDHDPAALPGRGSSERTGEAPLACFVPTCWSPASCSCTCRSCC